MESLRPPPHISFTGSTVAEELKKRRLLFTIYAEACDLQKKNERTQIATFFNIVGPDAVNIDSTLKLPRETERTLDDVLNAFDQHVEPQKNVVFERYRFWTREQHEGENVHEWVVDLKAKARYCDFGDQEDLLIRDKIVFGIRNTQLKERLLRESDLQLEKALDICRIAETSHVQVTEMTKNSHGGENIEIARLKTRQRLTASYPERHTSYIPREPRQISCSYCGQIHQPRRCPAFGKQCASCGKANHFAKACKVNFRKDISKSLQPVRETNPDEEVGSLYVGSIVDNRSSTCKWTQELIVAGVKDFFKLDTGAEANVLPSQMYSRMRAVPLMKSTNLLRGIGNGFIRPKGTIRVPCTIPSQEKQVLTPQSLRFYVVEEDVKIIGRDACENLGLVQRLEVNTVKSILFHSKDQLVNEYKEVFSGIGCYDGEYEIKIDPTVTPKIQPSRVVPFSRRSRLKEMLGKLQNQGIISPVHEPTDWVHNLVLTEKKNGTLRMCIDPKPLNKAIRRELHHIPTSEEVEAKLFGKKIFTVVDMSSAFWHIKLDERSSYLCTFHTPWGRMRFLRLPFGITCASEVLQRKNDNIFGSIPNVQVIQDDIIIAGEDEKEHDEALRTVMETAKTYNVKFRYDKIQYKINSVKYMGSIVSERGLQPDPAKVKAITDMPVPRNKHDIQRILGIIRYLARYIPNEASVTAPLRSLLKKEAAW